MVLKSGKSSRGRLGVVSCLVVLIAGLTVGISVAGAASSSPSPGTSKLTLRVGWAAEPNTLNPFRQNLIAEFEITHLNYDYLVGVDAATYAPKPELATSWSSSADGLTWTFKTRQGVKWQDGQPFTAGDVAFTFNYIIKNNLTNFTLFTAGIKDAVATDDSTVVFHLLKPWALMLRMYVPILPEHIWSKVPGSLAGSKFQNSTPIGTGPFQVVKFQTGQYVEMAANKNYWRGAPKVDEVIFQSYQNPNSMADELKSGAIDVAWDIPDAQFTQLQSTPGITAIAGLRKGFEELGMNCYTGPKSLGNPVLKDWKFRQALNWAVDKKQVLDTAYLGYGTAATTVIQPGYFQAPLDYHWEPPASVAYGFDIKKAGNMLTTAGYPLKNGVRLNKQGKPIVLRLVARANSAESQRAGKLLASWFDQLGLKISYQVLDESALLAKQYNFVGKTYEPDYDMFLWDWVGSGIDPNYILGVFTTAQIANFSDCQYSNPAYDALYAQQQTTTDPTARLHIIWDMQKILYQQSPYIVLVYARNLEAYNSAKWAGWVRSPAGNGSVIYNADNVDSYIFVQPVSAAAATSSSGSSNTGLIVIIVIIAVVVVVGGGLVLMRRRGRTEER
jgi:peptide/nickel transport system substrate-binding protein